MILKRPPLISADIRKQINFAIMVPSDNSLVDKKTVKYDPSKKILSFLCDSFNSKLIVSEQAFPDQFVDVPQAYDRFLQQLPTITSFEVINGQVNLAKPENLNGKTLAVMNGKGTFIFVHSQTKDLNENQWRTFFNSMDIIK